MCNGGEKKKFVMHEVFIHIAVHLLGTGVLILCFGAMEHFEYITKYWYRHGDNRS